VTPPLTDDKNEVADSGVARVAVRFAFSAAASSADATMIVVVILTLAAVTVTCTALVETPALAAKTAAISVIRPGE